MQTEPDDESLDEAAFEQPILDECLEVRDRSSLLARVGLNQDKAGLGSVDKQRANATILQMTEVSLMQSRVTSRARGSS